MASATLSARAPTKLANRFYDDNDFEVVDAVRTSPRLKRAAGPDRAGVAASATAGGRTDPIVRVTKPRHLDDAVAASTSRSANRRRDVAAAVQFQVKLPFEGVID